MSERKTKTIILVHNKQLLDQWLEATLRPMARSLKLLFDFRRGGGYPLYGIRS
ncbi:hypothetical protein RLB30_06065 [Streptococcus pneumoniae]|nr:hypothetical protein [Streptococcus pneumoniae]